MAVAAQSPDGPQTVSDTATATNEPMQMMETALLNLALVVAVALGSAHAAASEVEIIAHRGASHLAPENTLAAVDLAWAKDADAVEIDIRLTGDGRIILCHDRTTQRVSPGSEFVVAETPLATLQALDVGSWKGRRWTGQRMPTLADVLRTVPEGKRLFIEIKSGPAIVPVLARLLKQFDNKPAQLVLIGFSAATMHKVARALPDHPVYWLSNFRQDEEISQWRPTVRQIINQARKTGVDGVNLAAAAMLDEPMIDTLHAHGLEVYAWTVDDPQRARQLVEAGIDGITTNRPAWLGERLHEARSPDAVTRSSLTPATH